MVFPCNPLGRRTARPRGMDRRPKRGSHCCASPKRARAALAGCWLAAGGLALGIAEASALEGEPLLWRVSAREGEGVAYLFGALHYGAAELYPLPEAVERAFGESDALMVEINVLEQDRAEVARAVARLGHYVDGRRLEDELSAETWSALAATLERYGLTPARVARRKPWLVAVTLATRALERLGYSERYGVDRYFLERARAESKPVLEAETYLEQLDIFASLDPAEQELMLASTLAELDASEAFFGALFEAWRHGDEAAIDALLGEALRTTHGAERLYARLFTERNEAMARQVERLLATGDTYFVVFGTGHLVGEGGVVALLGREGYRISRP